MKIDKRQKRGRPVYECVNQEIEKAYMVAKAADHRKSVLLSKSFLIMVQNMVHQLTMAPLSTRNFGGLTKLNMIKNQVV